MLINKLLTKIILLTKRYTYILLFISEMLNKGDDIIKDILNLKEILDYLSISESMLRKLIREKRIPHFRIGNRIKFNLNEINKWIEKNQEKESQNSLFF